MIKDQPHPAPTLSPPHGVFTPRGEPEGYESFDLSRLPPTASVANASQVNFWDASASHSRERLIAGPSIPPSMEDRQNSQCSGSELNTKQSAGQKPTVHYPDDVGRAPSPSYFNIPPQTDSVASSTAGSDGEDEEDDDFDWSGDEDLAEEEAKFEKQAGVKLKSRYSLLRLFTFLFCTLIGSVFLAGVLVTPALIVYFFWYKPHPTDHRHYVAQNVEAWLFWAAANVVISWGLAMIVDIIPVIIRMLISMSWGHVSEEIKTRIELYNAVKDTLKPVLYATSAWISWIILFQNIFRLHDSSGAHSYAAYTDRVAQIIEFLFFFALVFCAQRMLSHAIAFAFHQTAYRERLQELKVGLRVIEHLRTFKPKHKHAKSSSHTPIFSALGFMAPFSGDKDPVGSHGNRQRPSPAHTMDNIDDAGAEHEAKGRKGKGKRKAREPKTFAQVVEKTPTETPASEYPSPAPFVTSTDSPHEVLGTPHQYPPTPVRRMSGTDQQHEDFNPAVQAARVIKSAVLHDARNIKGSNYDLSKLVSSVNTVQDAKRLARAIYTTFRDRHRSYLIPSDFYPAFHTHQEAEDAFRVFDRDGNGDISRSEIKSTVLRIYKERLFLSRSIRDAGAALKLLNRILLFFAIIILFFISLSIYGVNVTQSLTSVYTLGIAASFIFKTSASNAFDAIMFLFVTHPFDTGDRCFIDTENFVVKKMGLFATVFLRSDGTESYYFNSQLFTKFITNVRRSDKMAEGLTMQVAWRTPLAKLDELEKRLNEWLATEENRWFQPTTSIMLQSINFQRYLEISVAIPHNSTWQDWGLTCARRTAFCAAVQHYCRQLGIVCFESPMPIEVADADTQLFTPAPEAEVVFEDASGEGDGAPRNLLGFTPPHPAGSHLRARKSRGRKAAMRTVDG
ncbi:Mechanosensitive ion channel-domain-containing protein [Pisolithus croceorrhizus]|nr:Mechanosensitive ion channel-domain-containing protein [Pisolithus croceorrhizus]KAI6165021.1 Mechanosensitive ion channel-domain-containing protein [Pisolithus thermaeus]